MSYFLQGVNSSDPIPTIRRGPAACGLRGLGLLAPVMERESWDVAFCEAAVDDLSHHSIKNAELLIILGGPIGVYETNDYPFLTSEIALIFRWARASRERGVRQLAPWA